jgi:hypothetical protein
LALQHLLSAFALGDVADDFRSADDAALLISHGRNRDRHSDGPSILGDAYALVVLDALAASEGSKNDVLLPLTIAWNHTSDRLPDHLASRLAEQVLGGFIPTYDNTVGRFADNRIVRRCHDGSKPLLRLLGAPSAR